MSLDNLTETQPAETQPSPDTLAEALANTEQTDTDVSALDALTKDLTAVDLEPPLFLDGAKVAFEVKEATIGQAKESGEPLITFTLATLNPEKATKSRTLPKGRTFKHRINLGKTSKKGDDITEIRDRNLKQFRAACGCGLSGQFGHPTTYVGKRLVAVMGIEKGTGSFGDQNRITKFILPGAAAGNDKQESSSL